MSTDGTPAPTTIDLPEEEQEGPEQDRDREADDAARARVLGAKVRQGRPEQSPPRATGPRSGSRSRGRPGPRHAGRWTMIRAARQPRTTSGNKDRGAEGGVHADAHPHAPVHDALGQADGGDEDGGKGRRREKRRPDLDRLAVIGPGQEPRAEAGLGAGRQLADDGSDEADGDGHLQAREEVTSATRAGAASRRSAPTRPNRCA